MLFMGEEYGETAPFQYFTSHSDHDLIEAVRRGRLEEFDDFEWHGEPPDPHAEETFHRSKLNWSLAGREAHASLWDLYAELFRLRREIPALRSVDLSQVETHADDEHGVLFVQRAADEGNALLVFNFASEVRVVRLPFPGTWTPLLDSGARIEGGNVVMPAWSFGVFGEG
jgi:maltooligosyltrehalose trehalohydrolase